MLDDFDIDDAPLGRSLEMLRRTWEVDHAVQHLSRSMATRLGITGPQRLVLRVLGKRPRIAAGELAALLHLDASTMTGHIRKLEELGLLERRTAEDDARRAVLSLTTRGKKLDVNTPGTIEAAMESVLASMSVGDIAVVESFLSRFAEAVEAQTTVTKQERPRRIQRRVG